MNSSTEDNTRELFKRDLLHLKVAKLLSRESNAPNFRFGAVIAYGRRIIGVGSNNVRKTHPSSNTPYYHIHAELAAILNARSDMKGSTLYVFRAGKGETPLLAKPCKHCQVLIERVGIRTVVFSTTGGFKKVFAANLLGA